MEIHNARFNGEFKKTAEGISEMPFFDVHDIFSGTEIKRMQDVRFCLTLLVTAMSTYFNRDELLETYLEKFNDEFDEAQRCTREFADVFTTAADESVVRPFAELRAVAFGEAGSPELDGVVGQDTRAIPHGHHLFQDSRVLHRSGGRNRVAVVN
jgi:hypothetical protein